MIAKKRIDRINKDRPPEVKVVMLGNSITEQGGNWNTRLGRNDVFNCGQGGYTTQQFSWLLEPCVFDSKPEYCLIAGGINDLSIGVPLERIIQNYKFLISEISAQGIEVIVQSTIMQSNNSRKNPQVKELNKALRVFCRQKNLDYINLNKELSDRDGLKGEYSTDGTHLNEQGYEVWSGILRKYLEEREERGDLGTAGL